MLSCLRAFHYEASDTRCVCVEPDKTLYFSPDLISITIIALSSSLPGYYTFDALESYSLDQATL